MGARPATFWCHSLVSSTLIHMHTALHLQGLVTRITKVNLHLPFTSTLCGRSSNTNLHICIANKPKYVRCFMFFMSFYANNAYVCSWTLMALGLCVFKHGALKLFNSFQSIWLKFLSNLKPQHFWEHLEIILCHHLNKYLSFISLDNKLKKVMCVFYDAWSSGWEETTRPISRV